MPVPGRPFQPGQSGNPGGKSSFVKACEAAGVDPKKLTAELVEQLVGGMRELDKRTASWRFCVEKLIHYRLGKPKETIRHEFDEPGAINVRELSTEDLQDLLAAASDEPDPGELEDDAPSAAPR